MYGEQLRDILRIAELASDNFYGSGEDLEHCESVEDVQTAFVSLGIRWAPIVAHDVQLALNGYKPVYFVSSFEYAKTYRKEQGIYVLDGIVGHHRKSRGMTTKEIGDELRITFDIREKQYEALGVTLDEYAAGFACFAEMQTFYKSDAWQRKAKVTRYLWENKCTACNATNVPLHAHHETPIVSAYHEHCWVNFDDNKLRTLCEECHRKFHSKFVRSGGYAYYMPSDPGDVQQEKRYFTKLKKAHDMVKLCPHCYGYKPGWDSAYEMWLPE